MPIPTYLCRRRRPRFCSAARNCPVPLISYIKTIDGEGEDTDLLIPQVGCRRRRRRRLHQGLGAVAMNAAARVFVLAAAATS